jgi:hypothetical protein
VERCWRNTKLAVALHWSMLVDSDDPEFMPTISSMQSRLYGSLLDHNRYGHEAINGQMRLKAFLDRFGKEVSPIRCVLQSAEQAHFACGLSRVEQCTS